MEVLLRCQHIRKGMSRVRAPLYQPSCAMSKVNIKHPKPRIMSRRILEAVTQPIYTRDLDDPARRCAVKKYEKAQHSGLMENKYEIQYERFLIREALKIFEANRMILVVQPESMDMNRRRSVGNRLLSAGVEPVFFPFDIIRKCIENTRWVNMLCLIHRPTMLVVSPEPNVRAFLDVSKKLPELTLLGGLVEDQLMTRDTLIRYSQLPDIDGVRGQLVSVLAAMANQTHSLLGEHQRRLSFNLSQYLTDRGVQDSSSDVDESIGK